MLDVYRQLANRIHTPDALELAQELTTWHDAMVRHLRTVGPSDVIASPCDGTDDCPHTDAHDLWARAQQVFGEDADTLVFLRESARAMRAGSSP
jgi:hypothetical protein